MCSSSAQVGSLSKFVMLRPAHFRVYLLLVGGAAALGFGRLLPRRLGRRGRLLRRIIAAGSSPRIDRLLVRNIVEGALIGALSPILIRLLRRRLLLGLFAILLNMVLRQRGAGDQGKHDGDGDFAHRETPGSATSI